MTEEEAMQLQKDGANARAIGRSTIDCPLYKPEAMPAATGESVAEWEAKVTQWEIGWRAENLLRANRC